MSMQIRTPYSSAATAMMKSVWASGNLHLMTPSPKPTPNKPPSSIELIAKPSCVLGSTSVDKKPLILPAKCSEFIYAITPPIKDKRISPINKM